MSDRSLPSCPKRDKRDPCYTEWMYRLIRVFAGHKGLIVGFVMRWLIYHATYIAVLHIKKHFGNIERPDYFPLAHSNLGLTSSVSLSYTIT